MPQGIRWVVWERHCPLVDAKMVPIYHVSWAALDRGLNSCIVHFISELRTFDWWWVAIATKLLTWRIHPGLRQ